MNKANQLDLIASLSNEEGWIAAIRFHVRISFTLLLRISLKEKPTR